MTPAQFIIMIGSVAIVSVGLILFVRWESRHATSYFAKQEDKRRKKFAKKNAEVFMEKEIKTVSKPERVTTR